jgi:enoyl-CoA hydratase/carnithine racemase
MPPEADVRIEDAGPIRDIILNRRVKKNALTLDMYASLQTSLQDASTDDRISVVVLRSSGGAFCGGDDLSDALATQGEAPQYDFDTFARAQTELLGALAAFRKPLVAAINGLAAGVGAMISLYCDLVIASEFAAFEFSTAKAGIVPDAASCVLLGARIGLLRASEWLLLGERIKAHEALQLGLVNAVVPLERLADSCLARAMAVAALPPCAARETKRLLHVALLCAQEATAHGATPR